MVGFFVGSFVILVEAQYLDVMISELITVLFFCFFVFLKIIINID